MLKGIIQSQPFVGQIQGIAPRSIPRIELCQRAMHELGPTAHHGHTMPQRIADLGVAHRRTAMVQPQSFATYVMNHAVLQRQFHHVRGRAVARNAVGSTMDVHMVQPVVRTRGLQPYAPPTGRRIVVWQVIEHPVRTVATEHHRTIDRPFGHDTTVHPKVGSVVGKYNCTPAAMDNVTPSLTERLSYTTIGRPASNKVSASITLPRHI